MTIAAAPALKPLGPRESRALRALIEREAGIHLAACKEALLVGRLSRRLRELGMTSWADYVRRVDDGGDADERRRMLEAVCTHETRFFREPKHWELLAERVLPAWRAEGRAGARPRRVRAWSAACSTGEEAYTLAMVLRRHLPAGEGWEVEVTATDLSTRALERARAALWPLSRADDIPRPYLKAFMLKGTRSREGEMTVGPELRALVRFGQANLSHERYPVAGRFDLVFCRNVLIYFGREARARVIDRLLDRLEPGGLFFLGHAESLNGTTTRVRPVVPTVYQLAGAAGAARP